MLRSEAEFNYYLYALRTTPDWIVVPIGSAGAKGIYRGYEIDFL
ncbi:hypothetical protein LEP1GSC085_2294 [Leptospira interrogans str. L0996]|nr:hypothetical protein LEP1GSC085_2294 [Leptospira interrogans str. L0996]